MAGLLRSNPAKGDVVEIEGIYQAGARDQFFVAHIRGKQNNGTKTAVLDGLITEGSSFNFGCGATFMCA